MEIGVLSPVGNRSGRPGIHERETEMTRIDELLAEARRGHGRVLAIEGPAGIGKTTLYEESCALARASNHLVLSARGGELEREFPHGLVRQLFEAELRTRTPPQRRSLLEGAAALAAPVVSPGDGPALVPAAADARFAVTHGLFWLTSNVAEQGPLLIAVDDVQWSDLASLRFLVHLGRRLEGLAVLMIVCLRPGEPETPTDLIGELTAQPHAEVLYPAPLSSRAVAQMIASGLSEVPDDEFVGACHRSTGGTPLLVTDLIRQLATSDIRPRRAAVDEIDRVGSRALARRVLQRMERLPDSNAELARAVAVLGADGRLHRAARLAGLADEDAAGAVDALAAMNILRPGRPLQFLHPIMRNAVYNAIPAAARATAHARAAAVLAEDGADLDAVAGHLLLCEPAADPQTVDRLRTAAARAIERGAVESAAAYLRRALEEGDLGEPERAELLLELGQAERHVRPRTAVECFQEANNLTGDPQARARIACQLADAAFYHQWPEAIAAVESALAQADAIDAELAVQLETLRAVHDFYVQRLDDFAARLPQLIALAKSDSPAGRLLALHLAGVLCWLVQPPDEARRLLDVGLASGRFVEEAGPQAWLIVPLYNAFALTESLERGVQLSQSLIAESRRRGSIVGYGYAMSMRAYMRTRQGDLVGAEADARAGQRILRENGLHILELGTTWTIADAIIERPELDDEAERLLGHDIDESANLLPVTALLARDVRGRVRLARGDIEGGVADLRRNAEMPGTRGNPNGWDWRLHLALAAAPTDMGEAVKLVKTHLTAAHRVGLSRAIGTGLRTFGLIRGGEKGLAHLEEAVRTLEPSPARLEYARALVELGAARRRSGERASAREPLRRGLDLADRLGAKRLAERARTELVASGARPRRDRVTGRDALTASEQRIAEMAAAGMSNPQIAQALFVTRKTVENHLARIYGKLDIDSRVKLKEALSGNRS